LQTGPAQTIAPWSSRSRPRRKNAKEEKTMGIQVPELYFKPKMQVINDDQIKEIHLAALEILERAGTTSSTSTLWTTSGRSGTRNCLNE
jgi:trimethylamine:corrinoid methyltransferase-like protein